MATTKMCGYTERRHDFMLEADGECDSCGTMLADDDPRRPQDRGN